jgi:hypothetical protein
MHRGEYRGDGHRLDVLGKHTPSIVHVRVRQLMAHHVGSLWRHHAEWRIPASLMLNRWIENFG